MSNLKLIKKHFDEQGSLYSAEWEETEAGGKWRGELEIENLELRMKLNQLLTELSEQEAVGELVKKISYFQKAIYFLKLSVFEKLVQRFSFLSYSEPTPLKVKLTFKIKDKGIRVDATEPEFQRKETAQEMTQKVAKKMAYMRLQKQNADKMKDATDENIRYVLSRRKELEAILHTNVMIDSFVMPLVELPNFKYVPYPTVNILNAKAMPLKKHGNKYYTLFVRKLQQIISINPSFIDTLNEQI